MFLDIIITVSSDIIVTSLSSILFWLTVTETKTKTFNDVTNSLVGLVNQLLNVIVYLTLYDDQGVENVAPDRRVGKRGNRHTVLLSGCDN